MKNVGLALLLVISQAYRSQSRHELDSLLSVLEKKLPSDTNLALTYNEIAYAYCRINIDSAKSFADKALSISSKLNYKNGVAAAYNTLGIHYHMLSQFESALFYYHKSKKIKEELGDKKGVASSQNNMGIILYLQGNYNKALATFNTSLKIQESIHDTAGMPNTLNYMASVNYFLADYEKALDFYLKSLKLYERTNNKSGLCQAYNNLGTIYSALKNSDQAALNYNKSLELALGSGDKYFVISGYNNLGTVYQQKKDYVKALDYFNKSLLISRELKNAEGIAINLEKIGLVLEGQNKPEEALMKYKEALMLQEKAGQAYNIASLLNSLGSIHYKLKKNKEALSYYVRALKAAQHLGAKNLMAEISLNYAVLLKEIGDYKNAYSFFKQYASLRDTILSEEKNKSMAEMQTRFDTDAKEKEIMLLTKSKDIEELKLGEQKENIEKQKATIYASGLSIVLALALAFFGFRSYQEKKKINIVLEDRNLAISKQKEVLEAKNKLITNSIAYAKNIQDIILPGEKVVKECIKDSFIVFKPKDVVSGDFYWLNPGKKNSFVSGQPDGVLIAAVDCVGHGVPGGLMALHAYNLLENISKRKNKAKPSEILDELNREVIESLHQKNENTAAKHGMDLALLKIKENMVEYAGARNSLLIVNSGMELKEVKADKMFVGGALGAFTNNEILIEPGSMLYMFTDGYADQKGGPENEKYFISELKKLLVSVSHKNTEEQKEILEKIFIDWKGSNEQRDDVLVIGIRI